MTDDEYKEALSRATSNLDAEQLRRLVMTVYEELGDFAFATKNHAHQYSGDKWRAHDFGWVRGLKEAQSTIRYHAFSVADWRE